VTAASAEPQLLRLFQSITLLHEAHHRWPWYVPGICLAATLALACTVGSEQTGCTGFDERTAITRVEYAPCAREIMAVLDTLQGQLRLLVQGDVAVEQGARGTSRKLQTLWRQAGLWNNRYYPGTVYEVWPDSRVIAFNGAARRASDSYMLTLRYVLRPPEFPVNVRETFDEGSRFHASAKTAFQRTW
jgi:hypothetical protein